MFVHVSSRNISTLHSQGGGPCFLSKVMAGVTVASGLARFQTPPALRQVTPPVKRSKRSRVQDAARTELTRLFVTVNEYL